MALQLLGVEVTSPLSPSCVACGCCCLFLFFFWSSLVNWNEVIGPHGWAILAPRRGVFSWLLFWFSWWVTPAWSPWLLYNTCLFFLPDLAAQCAFTMATLMMVVVHYVLMTDVVVPTARRDRLLLLHHRRIWVSHIRDVLPSNPPADWASPKKSAPFTSISSRIIRDIGTNPASLARTVCN